MTAKLLGVVVVLVSSWIALTTPVWAQAGARVAPVTTPHQGRDVPRVSRLALFDADADVPIPEHDPLSDGATVNLATLPSRNLNIVALTAGPVSSVAFHLDGVLVWVDDVAPFSLAGDDAGDFAPWTPELGVHEVVAIPFAGSTGSGRSGPAENVVFVVIDEFEEEIRINCGGSEYVDGVGRVWQEDAFFLGGHAFRQDGAEIDGTEDDELYNSERFGDPFAYAIPVVGGTYRVTLHVAEIFWDEPARRLFDIWLEGVRVFAEVDIYSEVGDYAAYRFVAELPVTDDLLEIYAEGILDRAKLGAIEIERTGSGLVLEPTTIDFGEAEIGNAGVSRSLRLVNNSQSDIEVDSFQLLGDHPADFVVLADPPYTLEPGETVVVGLTFEPTVGGVRQAVLAVHSDSPGAPHLATLRAVAHDPNHSDEEIRINAGGSEYTDTRGREWEADSYFDGGSSVYNGDDIGNTDDDYLYQSQRGGSFFSYHIPVEAGTYEIGLHFAELFWDSPLKRVFDIFMEGERVVDDLDIWSEAGKLQALERRVSIGVPDGVLDIDFAAEVDNATIGAIEVVSLDHDGHPYLHVVLVAPSYAVDYFGAGFALVRFDGSDSHTHEPGRRIDSFTWEDGDRVIGTEATIEIPLAVGRHDITLTIADDNDPAGTLAQTDDLEVYRTDEVGGVYARYYPGDGRPLADFIDDLPATPSWVEIREDGYRIEAQGAGIGGSPFEADTVVELDGIWGVTVGGSYVFRVTGGDESRVLLDGAPVEGPIGIPPGRHGLRVLVAIPTLADLPARLEVARDGLDYEEVLGGRVVHDETTLAPFINTLPDTGSALGGERIALEGYGFFPRLGVVVHWGAQTFSFPEMEVWPGEITLVTPPGSGVVDVWVETPNGTSNTRAFTYDKGIVPVEFSNQVVHDVNDPTCAAWGPDGRLYVGSSDGMITILDVEDDWSVSNARVINAIASLPNNVVLGLGFNPLDVPEPTRLYVAHSRTYANGGDCFEGRSEYTGQVSIVEGPNFDVVQPLVTRLPASNHDHVVNGLAFDNQGNLLICVGSNTNAGVIHCRMGGLPESPLSGAIVKASLGEPDFDGAIRYLERDTDVENNDQVFGGIVDVAPGVDVSVYAPGLRNPFDVVFTTAARVYATDNGPNHSFGRASTGPDSDVTDPEAPDEVMHVVAGAYHGHPNRNRGRVDYREYIYRHPQDAPVFREHTRPMVVIPSSVDGIDEYRGTTFNDQLRGALLVQKWNGGLYALELGAGERQTQSVVRYERATAGLDVVYSPGGSLVAADYSADTVTVSVPFDRSITGMKAIDIFPWRAPIEGGHPFVIGGIGFGDVGGTTVTIGGRAAIVTTVSSTRVAGIIPSAVDPTADLLDVEVTSDGETSILPAAFRYVFRRGEGLGLHESPVGLGVELGSACVGQLDGLLWIFGEGSPSTIAFDGSTGLFYTDRAPRPFAGSAHHALEIVGRKIFLFGGLGGTEGIVQIYDPDANVWSLGKDMPFAAGAAVSAVIDRKIYVTGGLVGGTTTDQAAVYDPASDSWSTIAPMPSPRNHASGGSDGQCFWIFGGRGPGSGDGVTEGEADVFVFDPATNAWEASFDPGSTIPPLPQRRGGMSRAVFYEGEFYLFGGETTPDGSGQVDGDVYDRVDVFDPSKRTWRLERPMTTPRQGLGACVYDERVYLVGGGLQAGPSQKSRVVEAFRR